MKSMQRATQQSKRIFVAAASAAAAAILMAAPVRANDLSTSEEYRVVVKYSDLNLNQNEGIEVLYARLRSAARRVCVSYEGKSLKEIESWNNCYRNALSAAVAKVDVQAVTAFHLRATGRQGSAS